MSNKPKVLCLADLSVSPETKRILEEVSGLDILPPDRDTLLGIIHKYDAYLASLHVQFDEEVLSRAERLRVIATPSTGTDHIDLACAAERGISVITLKEETDFLDSITSTAELAWGLMLAVLRKIPSSFEDAKRGNWGRDKFRGHQVAGKTFGILGYGRLGRIVAEYAKAFRMRVIACDIRDFETPGVERVDFDTLLAESDILSIHIHLNDQTRGLIDPEAFNKMKPGIVLINTSRGAIIDEAAFVDALTSGKVSAAGIDVLHGEWNANLIDHTLIKYAREHDNLIITPHLGGITFEAQDMTLQFIAKKLIACLLGSRSGEHRR